jgi:Fic/DOC family
MLHRSRPSCCAPNPSRPHASRTSPLRRKPSPSPKPGTPAGRTPASSSPTPKRCGPQSTWPTASTRTQSWPCTTLLRGSQPEHAGKWRDQPVWIGGGDLSPHNADFVPPHHSRVEPAIADLVRFMDRDDMPPLVQAAIAHAQFETIHPFPDGNGRTGRALVQSLLRGKGQRVPDERAAVARYR